MSTLGLLRHFVASGEGTTSGDQQEPLPGPPVPPPSLARRGGSGVPLDLALPMSAAFASDRRRRCKVAFHLNKTVVG